MEEKTWAILTGAVPNGILALAKCIKQLVPNAAKNAKFHSSQLKASQFIAETVMQKRKATKFA
jgi:hypothetical protein